MTNALITTREDLAAVVREIIAEQPIARGRRESGPETGRRFLTRAEAADMLGVSPDTVKRWGLVGHLPEYRTGRIVRYREDEVIDLLAPTSTAR